MAKVLGFGGVFFRCKDLEATRAWYRDVLGFHINDYGGADFGHADVAEKFGKAGRMVWAPFAADTDYFGGPEHSFMVNLIVDDLTAVLAHAAEKGAEPVKPREDYGYGNFGWLEDPDGRRVELWEPKDMPAK